MLPLARSINELYPLAMARLHLRGMLAILLAVTLLASACTASPRHDSQHGDRSAAATLLRVGTTHLGPVTLRVPPGAVASGTVLRLEAAPPTYLHLSTELTVAQTRIASPFQWVLRPLYLDLSRELLHPVTLSFHLAAQLPEHLVLLTASPGGAWHIVPSSYDPTTGDLTADVSALSVWGILGSFTSSLTTLLDKIAKPLLGNLNISTTRPTCPRTVGLLAETSPGPVAWCIEAHDHNTVTVKFRNTARYWISLGVPDGAAVTVSGEGSMFARAGADLTSLVWSLASRTHHRYVPIPPGATGTLVLTIPPGMAQRFGEQVNPEAIFAQMAIVSLEIIAALQSILPIPSNLDAATSLTQLTSLVSQLGTGACLDAISSIVGRQLIPSGSSALSTISAATAPCLLAVLNSLPIASVLLMVGVAGITAVALVAAILQIVVAGVSSLIAIARGQGVQLMKIANPEQVVPTPPTPLPVVSFGAAVSGSPSWTGVKPISISLSGDAGNYVTGINWVEWGPSQAIGYGTSEFESCNPNCAQGSQVSVPTEVILSNVVAGKFTTLTEKRDGQVMTVPTSEVPSASGPSTSVPTSKTLAFGDRLSPGGIGPIRIGMTLSQVNAGLAPSDQVHQASASALGPSCRSGASWVGSNYIALDNNPGMVALSGRLAVLSLSAAGGLTFTTRGISLGSSLPQVLHAYPTAKPVSSSAGYTDYLFSADDGLGMLFAVDGASPGGVGAISAGLVSALLDCA